MTDKNIVCRDVIAYAESHDFDKLSCLVRTIQNNGSEELSTEEIDKITRLIRKHNIIDFESRALLISPNAPSNAYHSNIVTHLEETLPKLMSMNWINIGSCADISNNHFIGRDRSFELTVR